MIASSTFVLILFASRPEVSSSVAIATELVDSICTDAIILASWLAILVDAVIDVDLTPSSGIASGTGTGVIANAIDTGGAICTEVAGTVIDVGTDGAIAGKAYIALARIRPLLVGTRRIGVTFVGALTLVDVGTSSSTGSDICTISSVSLRTLTRMSRNGVGTNSVGIAVMRGGSTLIDIGTDVTLSFVTLLARAHKRSIDVCTFGIVIAWTWVALTFVDVDSTVLSCPKFIADARVVTDPDFILTFSTIFAWTRTATANIILAFTARITRGTGAFIPIEKICALTSIHAGLRVAVIGIDAAVLATPTSRTVAQIIILQVHANSTMFTRIGDAIVGLTGLSRWHGTGPCRRRVGVLNLTVSP